jgi:hypothetical protein
MMADGRIKNCEVGMFRLPGVELDRSQFTEEELEAIEAWAKENGGTQMREDLWSFRKESKRDWFTLKWS